MRTVLGIDAAWTLTEPSGVALAVERTDGWHLAAAASSYDALHAAAAGRSADVSRPKGSPPDARLLLAASEAISGSRVDLVAIDMPLSREPITSRRVSDSAVNAAYSSRWCSTHTPSATRPGRISDILRQEFGEAGYPLMTSSLSVPGIIEVYPHPALVELARAERRLTYKHGKSRKYWPGLAPADRRRALVEVWQSITVMLDARVSGVAAALPLPDPAAPGWQMKAFEDRLDAVVCAWVGIETLENRALPYGDDVSAVWIPSPMT